jgi:hypothetical protein
MNQVPGSKARGASEVVAIRVEVPRPAREIKVL